MTLVRQHSGSIANLYLNPKPNYQLAGGHIGKWLLDASRQPVMQSIFRDKALKLSIDPERRPRSVFKALRKKSEVTDQALASNYATYEAFHQLLHAQSDSETLAAARNFQCLLVDHR